MADKRNVDRSYLFGRGVYTMGEWCEMHHGENWGVEFCDENDAFARVYNNLLLHEYIYYFTPVHFLLAVCPFLY